MRAVGFCLIGLALAIAIPANAAGKDKSKALTECRAEKQSQGGHVGKAAFKACVERKMKGG
jgi:hypothetical protein